MDLIEELGSILSPSKHEGIGHDGVAIMIGNSVEGPSSQRQSPRKRGPRVKPTEDEVLEMQRFLLELEDHPNLWEPRLSHRRNTYFWQTFVQKSYNRNLTVEKARGLLRKLKSQIKYRIVKCEKDGLISRQILRTKGVKLLTDVLYVKYGSEFWRFCSYLTRALIQVMYGVKIAEYLSEADKRRLREEVGLIPIQQNVHRSVLRDQPRIPRISEIRFQQPMEFEIHNYAQPLPTTSGVDENQESNSGATSEGIHLVQIKSEQDTTIFDDQSFPPEDAGTFRMTFANVRDEPGQYSEEVGTNAGDQDQTEARGNLELEPTPFSLYYTEYYRIPGHEVSLMTIKCEPEDEQENGTSAYGGNPYKFFNDFRAEQQIQIREFGAPDVQGYPQVPVEFGISQEEFEDRCKAMEDFRKFAFEILKDAKDDEELKQRTIHIMNLIFRMKLLKEMGVSEEEYNRRLADACPRK